MLLAGPGPLPSEAGVFLDGSHLPRHMSTESDGNRAKSRDTMRSEPQGPVHVRSRENLSSWLKIPIETMNLVCITPPCLVESDLLNCQEEFYMKLREALERFLLVDRSKQTCETYAKFLSVFVNAIGPERPLELIRPEDIDAYIRDMRFRQEKYTNHPSRPTEHEPLSPATIYKNIKMIKSFFKWCVDRRLLTESPAAHIVNSKPGIPLGQGKAATDEEVEALIAVARGKPRNYAIVLLLSHSGCRAGELACLRIRDLDLDRHCAMVNGKGADRRWIYFNEATSQAIRNWLEKRPDCQTDHVFVSGDGKPMQSASVSQVIRRLSQTAGLSRSLGAHSLRHRVGLKFARERVAPRVAQHYLGHANVTTTLEYYQDVDESDLRNAGRLLSRRRSTWQEDIKQNPAARLIKKPRTGS